MVRKAPKGFKNKAKGGKGKSLSKKAISDISKATRFAESIGSDKKFSDLAKQYKQYDVKYPDRPPTFRASYGDEVNKVGTPLASTYYKDPVTGEERFFTAQAPTFKQLMGDIGRGLFSGYNTLSYDPNAGGIPTTTGGQIVRRQGLFPLLANKAMSGEFGLMGLAKGLYDRFKSGTQQGIETVGGLYDNLRSAFSGQPTVNYGGGSTMLTTTNESPRVDLTPTSINTETLPSMDLNRNIGDESDPSIFGITNTGVPLPFLRSTVDNPNLINVLPQGGGYLPEGFSNVGIENPLFRNVSYEPIRVSDMDMTGVMAKEDSRPVLPDNVIPRTPFIYPLPRNVVPMTPVLPPEVTDPRMYPNQILFAKNGGSVDKYAGLGYKLK